MLKTAGMLAPSSSQTMLQFWASRMNAGGSPMHTQAKVSSGLLER